MGVAGFAEELCTQMASQSVIRWLLLVQAVLLCICTPGDTQCDETEQPVISGIDPPSGPGGFQYTLSGEQLNQTTLEVTQDDSVLTTSIVSENATTLQFTIVRPDDGPARVALIPSNPSCFTPNISIELRSFGKSYGNIIILKEWATLFTFPCLACRCGG